MYAIFEDSGRQYKVSAGDKIYIDLREVPEGETTVAFDRVLLVGEGEAARIGQPLVAGAKVVGKLEGMIKGPKVENFKMRERKNYRRKIGHRQKYLQVTISEIVG